MSFDRAPYMHVIMSLNPRKKHIIFVRDHVAPEDRIDNSVSRISSRFLYVCEYATLLEY